MQSSNALKVLAVGAAGPSASLVVPELLRRSVSVRAFVHKSEDEPTVQKLGVTDIVVGELSDAAAVAKALEGIDAVFYIAPAALENEAEVGKQFVLVAKQAGVRRVVFSSVIHPVLSELVNHADKAPVEEALLDSGLEYVFLHPAMFFQNIGAAWAKMKETGVYGEPWSNETRFSRVDYRDVAELAAIALTEDRLLYGTFELCAEGNLNRHDLAALMSQVVGKQVKPIKVEIPAQANIPPKLTRMFAWYDKHALLGNSTTLRAILGREPRTLRAFFEELNSNYEIGQMAQPRVPGVATYRSETALVDGVRLHYWIGGNPHGKPALLWHGFLGTGHSWYKVMPVLVAARYSVLVPDMRGYGDSDKPSGNDGYDARALAEEFRTLAKQIEFGKGQKLIPAAHDMGAHPALLWAADHPDEIACLMYMKVSTMLEEFLTKVIAYTPEAMARGSMWWWILPLAPGVPERLIVGHERAFLTWFCEGATADPASITEASIEETLRSFSGTEGVLGALGVYRAAFTTIDQTTPLKKSKVEVPVLAIGGEKALGAKVAQMVEAVAKNVTEKVIPACGHFIPEEQPAEFMRLFSEFVGKVA